MTIKEVLKSNEEKITKQSQSQKEKMLDTRQRHKLCSKQCWQEG